MIQTGIALSIISYGAVMYGIMKADEALVAAGIYTFVVVLIITVILMLADKL